MSDTELTQDAAYQLRRALGAVRDLREKLQAVESKAHEPIAIIGMACRLPGGPDLATFWRTLVEGRDAIREVPPARWDLEALYDPDPDAPGKMNTRWGGLIDDVDRFDPTFFGISPREAVSIDPQQRLLLEVAWHALEHAGIAPDRLTGSLTGVYVGLSTHDYAEILGDRSNTDWIDAHASLGNSAAVAAGRLAYTLGLQGPAMVVDTACSSSLVAIHLAGQALRAGEISLALVGGVNLTLRPELTIGFSKARMMAADGRCKTFDAAADGYVRGEGCGVVVLKRLSDALAAGDRIEAVIRGSAVNQDGHSNGLTAPNGPAQVAVIRAALANAGVEPAQVSCIEAHGTGTTLGDPIEARALTTVFGGERAGTLPAVGSVKTQIGHLEAAAGIAGLIKIALALRHATLPPHLHFHTLNPHIAADGFPFHIPTVATPWLPVANRRIAGVSSFGFSGTNAHIVLEEAPRALTPSPLAVEGWGGGSVLALSTRDLESLAELRRETDAALAAPDADPAGLAATLSAGRAQYACRIAVVAEHAEQARKALVSAQLVRAAQPPAVAFLFTGQGCQYPGMARGLMAEPRFREIIERCETVLAGRLERSLTDLLLADDAPLDRTDLLQPALFALEYAIAELWRGWGIEPVAVLGHSVGEIAAACFAGAMSLEEGLIFIAERGRLMATTAGQGGMAAAFASPETVTAAIAGTGAAIAAHNGPANTVASGDIAALTRALSALDQAGIAHRRLDVATAFHSPVLDPCLNALEQAAAAVSWRPARLPIASNLSGTLIHQFDAGYWRRQAREPVAFTEGLRALAERGCTVFLEVGPRPILSALGREIVDGAEFIAALRQGIEPRRALTEALARLYTAGAPVDWNAYWGPGWRRVEAPLYPFRRDRFWPATSGLTPPAQTLSHSRPGQPAHPLLGHWLDTPLPQRLFETWMTTEALPFLADHVVFGEIVVPGAMHAVLALIAAQVAAIPYPALEDVVFAQALTVPLEGVRVQFILEPSGAFALHSQREGQEWVRHATGQVATEQGNPPNAENLEALRTRLTRDETGTEPLFAMLSERGIRLGPAFQGIQALWRGAGEALAEIRKPEALGDTASLPIHPALLDACFQTLGATFSGEGASGGFLPLSIDRVRFWRSPPERFWCHVTTSSGPASAEVAVGHFQLLDAAGQVFMTVEGLQIKRVSAPAPADPLADALLELDWVPAPLSDPDWADPTPLADVARALDTGLPTDQGLANDLERLATAFAADALRTLGLEPESNADVAEYGIAESRRRLFHRVAEIAILDPEAALIGGATLAETLRARYPANALEIDLVARCGGGLAGVLTGQADPLQLLFTPGDNIYSDSGLARAANAMTAAAVAEALQRRGPGPVRILEVGAGTGATTAALLPLLQGRDGSRYQFTDIAPAFLTAAQRVFGDQQGIEFTRFDLEQPLATQGLTPGSFDIVIAANVVHATADLRRSLTHLCALLAPGGLLALVESTAAQRWWDLVFGLTEGWWRFTDTDLRPHHPLLPAETWRSLLTEQGFAATVAVGIDQEARQSLILARADWKAPLPLFAVHDGSAGPARQLAEALARALQNRGGICQALSAAEALPQLAETASAGVVYTGGVDAPGQTALHQAFDLIRAMATAGRERLWLVTQGAQNVAGVIAQPDSALLWGLGKVAALEHPELRCHRIDLDPAAPNPAADLVCELLADDAEPETAWRDGQRYASRLSPVALPTVAPPTFDPQGRYLITGAFGGLGPLLAEWLIGQGAGALMLIGHHPPTPALAERLQALGPQVQLQVADVADRAAMSRLFADLDREGPPLRGIFHLAGGVADGALLQQDWERFASVLPAKVEGARILDALTRDRTLDYFVLFSTSAALIGNRGQANHAAANAVLDALGHARRASGLPGLSLNWGAWGEIGAVVDGAYAERLQASGARPISPAAGLEALSRALQGDRAQLGVIPVDWPIFLAGYGEHIPPFFERLVRAPVVKASPAQRSPDTAPSSVDLRSQLAAVAPEQRRVRLMTLLQTEAAAVLGIAEPDRIDPDQPLSELGLDSLLALELRTRLGTATGGKLPATLLFNYPSVAALTGHLLDEVLDLGSTEPAATARSADEDALRAEIAELSEADLEALIDDELSNLI
ncbi:MAG: SDR family NAD(P)-dependent oxidoreductase [Candidatus Contendobacter sp.]|jgi:acyl transferase domain-containing protein/acyl carrier protein|nr:SDR family NAD(P)-dependent oxidoreductase [Gammaproteobacteria bacterium]MCC8993152.1 SDR family NAD(P)-dependent oxidoreductase [Candidatus Contendobacter sp.]